MAEGDKILVTGGAGFIGSHTVVELAQAGYDPIVLDNFQNSEKSVIKGLERILERPVRYYNVDCTDEPDLEEVFQKEGEIQGVIHFAADKAVGESVHSPLKYYHNNVGSLVTLLQVMQEMGTRRLVFSSSCTVYGQPDKLPVTEEAPVKPAMSPYGNTKQVCEEIIRDVIASGSAMQAMSLRYFNPIGAHPSAEIGELPLGTPNNLIPFITQTVAGIRPQLTVFGSDYKTHDGTCVRDYIHVVDLAKAHVSALQALEESSKESYYDFVNLGTGHGSSVLDVIHAFEHATGEKVNYRIAARRPGDVEQVYASCDKAWQLLSWKTELSLEDGLKDAWRWQKRLTSS